MLNRQEVQKRSELFLTYKYYVQDGDTVIYVFNYGQDQGYLMLGADNSSYPILAQSREGRLDLKNINNIILYILWRIS